jgi:hypothetical protein
VLRQSFVPSSKEQKSERDAVSVCSKEVKDIKEDNDTSNDVTSDDKRPSLEFIIFALLARNALSASIECYGIAS